MFSLLSATECLKFLQRMQMSKLPIRKKASLILMIMSKVERQTRWGDALITNCRMVIVASMYVIISPSYRHVYII